MKTIERWKYADGERFNHDTTSTDPDPVESPACRDDGSVPARTAGSTQGKWYGAFIEPLASVSVLLKNRTCTMCGRGYESPANGGGNSRFCADCRVIRDKQIHGTPTITPVTGGTHGTQQESAGEV